jgi:hypothetical protein
MDIRIDATPLVFGFLKGTRSFVGLIVKPYETMRRIAKESTFWEVSPIALLLIGYFTLASLVKTASFRPYLLTKQFILLSGGALVGCGLAVVLIYVAGIILRSSGTFRSVVISWAHTLYPTVAWFFMTSLLFVILPPPRTARLEGLAFSFLYIVISTALLSWKVILGYLTLRFSLRFGIGKILLVTILVGPFIALYYYFMYKIGIFRIPFL